MVCAQRGQQGGNILPILTNVLKGAGLALCGGQYLKDLSGQARFAI